LAPFSTTKFTIGIAADLKDAKSLAFDVYVLGAQINCTYHPASA